MTANIRFGDIISQFSGEGDFAEWLAKLELVATLQGITALEKFLPLFLSKGAFAVYQSIADADKKVYDKVKQKLLDAFSADATVAYEELQARKLAPGEAVDVYLADVNRLARLVDTAVSETWIKCAFIAGLPDDTKRQVKAACSTGTMSLQEVVERTRTLIKTQDVCCVASRSYHERGAPRDVAMFVVKRDISHTGVKRNLVMRRRSQKTSKDGH